MRIDRVPQAAGPHENFERGEPPGAEVKALTRGGLVSARERAKTWNGEVDERRI